MNKPTDLARIPVDHDDIDTNVSSNEHFSTVLEARLSRRSLLRGGAATAASALLGAIGLSGCGGSDNDTVTAPTPPVGTTPPPPPPEKLLGFSAVSKSLADTVVVPAGYTASVLYALGDPLTANTAAYKNDGTDGDFENRAGDHHDGMEFFPLSSTGTASTSANDRGLLAMNHEATTDEKLSSFFVHANGGTMTLPRPAAEVDKEMALHGLSVVEVRRNGAKWEYLKDSSFNRRVHQQTEVEISGPVRGNALVVTKYSTNGTKIRGTLNNCGTGKTPWNTYLSGEENWAGYFTRAATDDAARGDRSVVSLNRYGRNQGAASRHGWETGGTDDKYQRWDISKKGASIDGSDDYRNEMNGMGYIVEMDAYDKAKAIKKRTALGRFAHESAVFGKPVAGQPLAVYMGDDSRNEYIFKFVSTAVWAAADATAADRIATGDKYLDSGKLYVAKFAADGTGQWIELSISNPAIASYAAYKFADQADVLVNARLAGDAVGATKMDRPEWCSVHPGTGEIYFTLTNNSNRRVEPSGSSQAAPDAANPRVYTDMKGTTAQQGNPNGHIIRVKEGTAGSTSTSFNWDVYLFGAEAGAAAATVNLSGLTADQDFSSPDGLAFSTSTGICWIQTDDGAYTDVTNCMMLAGVPGKVGDGKKVTLNYPRANGTTLSVDTYVGQTATTDTLKRFLVGPVGSEITGIAETPDGKALFVNIQHPGENTAAGNIADPAKYTSQWPSNAGYGAGKRPRSATIVITKNDGGRIGT
ncbi:PhoX family phosphatase [Massilia sp. BSC265]|uniref:PhoX family protein n=1 Tax=Massilia sp. BSC265 TaxID=1549812 RepID=UPI0004E922B5|nr:PhoX family phosphatase [Massilia sp. BSC265]KFI05267.1 phosphatase [Massilia sp. BSC265]